VAGECGVKKFYRRAFMRITGGILKNRIIIVPKAHGLRPTTDKARSAFFSSIGDIVGFTFLDLFAGTGAVGLEAKSRGAGRVVFFDRDISLIEKNAALIPAGTDYAIIKADVSQAPKRLAGMLFDIIYIDPPYSLFPAGKLIAAVKDNLAAEAVIAYEESVRTSFTIPEGFHTVKERRYGDTVLRYIKLKKISD
jgi:16S rRNA (guanine966-N2)-methyltransferase